jgi:hypothetical protein
LDDLRFYIGKDGETLWANKTVATDSKTKSKNTIKVFLVLRDKLDCVKHDWNVLYK